MGWLSLFSALLKLAKALKSLGASMHDRRRSLLGESVDLLFSILDRPFSVRFFATGFDSDNL